MYNALGRAAIRFSVSYVRRRYRREIRLGAVGLATAGALALAAYLAARGAPEG